MTATRDPDRLLRAWLDLMPDEAPDRVVSAVLQATERLPQVRRQLRPTLWRLPMNRISILATAAVVAVVVGGLAFFFRPISSVGPQASPSPTLSDTPVPTQTPALPAAISAPMAIRSDWMAEAPPIDGLPNQGARIQLAFTADGGASWLQMNYVGYEKAMRSFLAAAPAGEIRLVASDLVATDYFGVQADNLCANGAEGRYRWQVSSDGLFLTLELIDDQCALRATAIARTWVHSLGAQNQGGAGIATFGDRAWDLQMTLPKATWGMDEVSPVHLSRFDDVLPARSLVVLFDPSGYTQICNPSGGSSGLGTATGLVDYLRGQPDEVLDVESLPATIDSKAATHVTAAIAPEIHCGDGEPALFDADGNAWTIPPSSALSLWAVEIEGELVVFWYSGPDISSAEEQALIETVHFTDGLPTP